MPPLHDHVWGMGMGVSVPMQMIVFAFHSFPNPELDACSIALEQGNAEKYLPPE
jgi:hypothetical protein